MAGLYRPHRIVDTVEQGDHALPTTLRWAVALLFAQAVSLAGLLGFLIAVIGGQRLARLVDRRLLPFEILALVVAVVLVLLGWQLRQRRAWARGPVVALELLFVPIGYYLGGLTVGGILTIVSALVCVGLLIAPASRAALGIRP